MHFVLALLAAAAPRLFALRVNPSRVGSPIRMGGLEQKLAPITEGARVSLLLDEAAPCDTVLEVCRACADDVTGVVYALRSGRIEIIGEGDRTDLESLVAQVRTMVGDGMARETWQLPVGGYESGFPLVALMPTMAATISMDSTDPGTLDYISRHLQTEAVFNRGLRLSKKKRTERKLVFACTGQSERLKSFVRWCYMGPPLARADKVEVSWAEAGN